jgi:2-phospho-L-lactate guanylyltransferase
MLFDVLDTLATCIDRDEVSVVTSDSFALELAQHFHFAVIPDHANRSETDAIEVATEVCQSRGIESILVIPGDIPLIRGWEVEKIFEVAPPAGSVLVPAADGRGTNAIWRCPAGLFPLRFGNDSFKPHLAAAQATKKPCVIVSLPGIALDVDTPSDLVQLAAASGETRAQQLIRHWDLASLPMAANE